jgi:hypothetical protein
MEANEAMGWDEAERARMRNPDFGQGYEETDEPDLSEAEAAMVARLAGAIRNDDGPTEATA